MALSDIARRLESVAATATIASRTVLGLETNPVPADWTHITKVDPETDKQLPLAYPLYLSRTSAVSVGGSRDVTDRNTEETFELLSLAAVPAFHEPSGPRHVTDKTREQAEFLAVPEVLNGDTQALIGTLGEGLEYAREELAPEMVEETFGISVDSDGTFGKRLCNFAAGYLIQEAIFEAYIIMNPDSAAAREAAVTEEDLLTPEQAKQRALAAEHHLESEVIYLEYSGTFGGEEAESILEAIDGAVTWPQIWYGGGLDNRDNVEAVLDAGADAVVVGDIFHSIAAEERRLFDEARDRFDGIPATSAVEEWIADELDIQSSTAYAYLSTIPGVEDPADAAKRYLAAGVEFALVVDAIREEDSLETIDQHSSDPDSPIADTRLGETLAGTAGAVETLAVTLVDDDDAVHTSAVRPSHLAIQFD